MKKIILSILFLFFVSNAGFADDSTLVKDNNKGLSVKVISTGASSFIKINYEPYINKLAHLIFANWDYNEPESSASATFLLNIDRNGIVKDYKTFFDEHNEDLKFYASVIDAVKSVKVYNESFPKNYTPDTMQVQLIFLGGKEAVDFAPYMRDLQYNIRSKWDPPKFSESKRVILLMKIAKDGRLLAASIFQSSGNKVYDDAALEAVYNAQPFKPLPEGFKGWSIDIQFTLDYNVNGVSYIHHPPKPAVNWQNASGNHRIDYITELDKTLHIVNKNLMRYENGFNYIYALKLPPFTSNAYLLRCKIDCKNRQIGVKKSYEGIVSNISYPLPRYVKIFTDKVKMTKPESNQDYLKIYNFVCEP